MNSRSGAVRWMRTLSHTSTIGPPSRIRARMSRSRKSRPSRAPAPHPHHWRAADPAPGPGTRWRHRLPGLVLEDDPAAARRRGALTRGQTSFFHSSTASSSSRSMVRRAGCRHDHPCRRPSLVCPAVGEWSTLQPTLQPVHLLRTESRAARRAPRQDPDISSFAPGTAPPLHRPLAHPQRGRDLPVLLPAPDAFHGLQPDPLPRSPPGVGQPAALRVFTPHDYRKQTTTVRRTGPTSPDQVQ